MRTKFSTLNIMSNICILIMQTILSFIVRIIFTKTLGQDYLGIEGVLVNLISMFSLAELGITLSISFSLYKPLAEKDIDTISALMSLYKKIYNFVGITILIIGVLLIPFLDNIINITSINNFYIIYILYLLDAALTYLITYKEVLIIADQKSFKIAKYNLISIFLIYILQIVFLFLTKNFMIYVLIQILVRFIQRIIINKYIGKIYSNIDFNSTKKLNKKEISTIKKNVKSMFYQKIGNYLLNGTDNLIISKFIGIGVVGVYSNFLSITTILKNIINSITSGITASFGNLIVKDTNKTQENVFNIMNFITFVVCGFITISLYFLLNPFIMLCFGKEYILNNQCIIVICLNFYISSMLLPLDTVKGAAGIYEKDKYVSLLQAFINLVLSVILVKEMGLLGVLLGTLFSYLIITLWNRPYIVYKYVFKSSIKLYFFKYFLRCIFLISVGILLTNIISQIVLYNKILDLILKGIVIVIVYVFLVFFMFFNTIEFKYVLTELKKRLVR